MNWLVTRSLSALFSCRSRRCISKHTTLSLFAPTPTAVSRHLRRLRLQLNEKVVHTLRHGRTTPSQWLSSRRLEHDATAVVFDETTTSKLRTARANQDGPRVRVPSRQNHGLPSSRPTTATLPPANLIYAALRAACNRPAARSDPILGPISSLTRPFYARAWKKRKCRSCERMASTRYVGIFRLRQDRLPAILDGSILLSRSLSLIASRGSWQRQFLQTKNKLRFNLVRAGSNRYCRYLSASSSDGST